MARTLKTKELINTRLATNYGGWMYCNKCNENIGYLCYSTYDKLELKYKCNCGSQGSVLLDFEDSKIGENCNNEMKNWKKTLEIVAKNENMQKRWVGYQKDNFYATDIRYQDLIESINTVELIFDNF